MAENKHPVNRPASEASSVIIGCAYKAAAVLKERALAVDRPREIPVEAVKELHRSGFLSMSIPRAMGGTNKSRDQGLSWRLCRLRTVAFHQLFSPMPLGPTYCQGAGCSNRPKPSRARWPMFDRTAGR